MSKKAKVTVDPAYKIGRIESKLFSAFLEPIGNWVYGGIYSPNHPSADEQGFRTDILDAIKKFDLPAVRLPGGNFMSGWDWKDSIGPRENRKGHLDLAWKQFEPNEFGHDEYLQWAAKSGAETLYTLNLGTGDINSAVSCVEYTNFEGGTYWSDLRKQNGHAEPYNVRTWYLGNEMDGPWQINSFEKDPKAYGIKAYEIAKVLKYMDPDLKIGVCGSSSPLLTRYPDWERIALEECYPLMDYLSIHYYHWAPEGDYAAFLNGATLYEKFLNTEIGICDYVQSKYRHPGKMMISFDEYGISFNAQERVDHGRNGYLPLHSYAEFKDDRRRPFNSFDPRNPSDRSFTRKYAMMDALGQASVLVMLMRHANRVKIGCMTGGIRSAIAFDSQHTWNGATYYPFYQLRHYGTGESILPAIDTPTFSAKGFDIDNFHAADDYYDIPYIDASASLDEEKGEAAIFFINRNWEEDMDVRLDVRGFEGYDLVEHQEMYCYDDYASNSFGNEQIHPVVNSETSMDGGIIDVHAKKLSFNMIRLKKRS